MVAVEDTLPRISIERLTKRYGNGPRGEWAAAIYGSMLEEAERLARPGSIYAEYSLDDVKELTPWLPDRTAGVVLGVCTLGSDLEVHIHELFPEDPAAAVVLDEICLALVSASARHIHAQVRQEALERGMRAGPPYRAGLGRWPLEVQRVIFDQLPAEKIGVTLDEYLIMRPVKSTSLIIPLYRE